MSTNYVPTISFSRPAAEPRVLINTAAILDGAIPVTQVYRAGEDIQVNTNGEIQMAVDDSAVSLQAGDYVKISGVTTEGYTGLNGRTLRVKSSISAGPAEVKLQDTGYRPESAAVLNGETKVTLQLGFSYVEFYGFKATGVANAAATLVGPSSAACLQPLGLGTKDGYASTPVEGRRWNLQDWYFKVAANDDGAMMLVWK